jgi:hypothetical protein
MSNRHFANLLWADDDSTLMLKPLKWGLERGGLTTWEAKTYAAAQELLDSGTVSFDSLLVDTILPRTRGGTLNPYTGLDLAEYAAQNGVRCIGFLSVVALSEVFERYNQIVAAHPQVSFHYANKLMLLEPYAIEQLIEALMPPKLS